MTNTESEVKPLRGYSEEPIFYVYVHKRPIVGTVFYVGKGRDERAWVEKDRNPHWRNVVNKHGGFEVEIIKSDMTEQEAYAFEAETILKYGIDNLTNQTLGGISTTGYRHSQETRNLQSKIAKDRLENNEEYAKKVIDHITKLAETQTPEFREWALSRANETTRNYSPEQREEYITKKTAWLNDEDKKATAIQKMLSHPNRKEIIEASSNRMKLWWANMSEEDRKAASARSASIIMREGVRLKLSEMLSIKLVVNRRHLFKSIRQFLEVADYSYPAFSKAVKRAEKENLDFFIANSLFIEKFDEDKHTHLQEYNGEDLRRLDFDVLPRSKAVVMDDRKVFLSMREASIFCNGKSVDATADFITKNIRRGKPAMGHNWRVATKEEVVKEILERLEKLDE